MEPLTVSTSGGTYPIRFLTSTPEVLTALEPWHREGRRMASLLDAEVARAHPDFAAGLERLGPVLLLPGGERSKEVSTLERVWGFCAESGLDRQAVLLVCGGGVLGDCGGFAAATWLRGIRFVQIPTTLLAMVDSSVGGKTGLNTAAGKNLVGAFHQPVAVLIARAFLTSLPERELSAGMAEIIKAGMLADADFFHRQAALQPPLAREEKLDEIIRRACAIKAEVVSADEKESAAEGGRALLNLGHTFAHAIENVAGYGTYLHGEAVAIGLMMATDLSVRLGRLEDTERSGVRALLEKFALPTRLRTPLLVKDLLAAMAKDKKNRQGQLRLVLLKRIGEAVTASGIEPDEVGRLWSDYGAE